jgi:hypothetical protein
MARLLTWLLCGLAAASIDVRAANSDDGFIWIDANTRIKLTPVGSNAGTAATGASAPEQPKEKAKRRKKAEK